MSGAADLKSAVENIISAKQTESSQHIIGLIFAFTSLSAEAALRVLAEVQCDARLRPIAVFLLEHGAVIQQERVTDALRYGGGDSPYELRQCQGDNRDALALAYFVLLFLYAQFSYGPSLGVGREDVWMAMDQFLAQHTRLA
jgi:hypothetical protein